MLSPTPDPDQSAADTDTVAAATSDPVVSPGPAPVPERPRDRPRRVPACPRRRVAAAVTLTWRLLPNPLTDPDTEQGETTGSLVAVWARLTWSRHHPREVTATFATSYGAVVWRFGRELLTAGLTGPSGIGDVTMRPDPTTAGVCRLSVCTPSGYAAFRLDTAELAGFLGRLPDPPDISPEVAALVAAIENGTAA